MNHCVDTVLIHYTHTFTPTPLHFCLYQYYSTLKSSILITNKNTSLSFFPTTSAFCNKSVVGTTQLLHPGLFTPSYLIYSQISLNHHPWENLSSSPISSVHFSSCLASTDTILLVSSLIPGKLSPITELIHSLDWN